MRLADEILVAIQRAAIGKLPKVHNGLMKPAIALAALLCGCTLQAPAMNPTPMPSPMPLPAARGPCDARPVQALAGRPFDAALGDQLRQRSGAERVRVVRPGQMVTMEFDERRLTVELDARGHVAAVRCG